MSSCRHISLLFLAACFSAATRARGDADMDSLSKLAKNARAAGEIYARSRFRGEKAAAGDVLLVFCINILFEKPGIVE